MGLAISTAEAASDNKDGTAPTAGQANRASLSQADSRDRPQAVSHERRSRNRWESARSLHERVSKVKDIQEVVLYYDNTLAKHLLSSARHFTLIELVLHPAYPVCFGVVMLLYSIGFCLRDEIFFSMMLLPTSVLFSMLVLCSDLKVMFAILKTFRGVFLMVWMVVFDVCCVMCWTGPPVVIIVQTIAFVYATFFFIVVEGSVVTIRTRQVFGISLLGFWAMLAGLLFFEVDGFFRDSLLFSLSMSTKTVQYSARSAATSAIINLFMYVANDVREAFSSNPDTTNKFQQVENVLLWRWKEVTTGTVGADQSV